MAGWPSLSMKAFGLACHSHGPPANLAEPCMGTICSLPTRWAPLSPYRYMFWLDYHTRLAAGDVLMAVFDVFLFSLFGYSIFYYSAARLRSFVGLVRSHGGCALPLSDGVSARLPCDRAWLPKTLKPCLVSRH